MIEKG